MAGICFVFLVSVATQSAMAWPAKRTKNIPYVTATSPDFSAERHILDVYQPRRKSAVPYPVVIFIHGGNWNSGSKNIYTFIGRRLAKQGVVAVIINYRLAPAVLVPAMADDCARAVLWTTQHISEFGGEPNRIFVMGHSAGGGLAALVATKDALFIKLGLPKSPVKGAILDDAAGLDMYSYLLKMAYPNDKTYLSSFGTDSTAWRAVSPLYFLRPDSPPMLLYTGSRTYPSLTDGATVFSKKLRELGVKHTYTVLPGKKHVAMVTQLFWKNNIIYRDLLQLVGG